MIKFNGTTVANDFILAPIPANSCYQTDVERGFQSCGDSSISAYREVIKFNGIYSLIIEGTKLYELHVSGDKRFVADLKQLLMHQYFYKDNSNNTIQTGYCLAGETIPAFNSTEPTKSSTAQYEYTFSGWDYSGKMPSEDISLSPQFSSSLRSYTVYYYSLDSSASNYGNSISVQYGKSPTGFTARSETAYDSTNLAEYTSTGYWRKMSSSSDIQPAGTGTYTSDNLPAITGNTYFNLTYFKWSVATASGASYGFTRDDSTGYWKSTNAGVNSSASVSVVTVVLPVAATITVNYINYAEATYDYGIIGTLGATLDTTNTADSSNVALSMKTSTYNVSTEQTFSFDKQAAGTYTFYIKYRKDGSVNSNNDSLQFKLTFS